MAAINTPFYDLIEVTGINAYQLYQPGMGNILGFVDTATYTDDDSDNSATQIAELNDQDGGNAGTLTLDGVDHDIQLYVPDGSGNDVTVTADQGTFNLGGDGGSSQIVMIMAVPTGGGAARYFFAIDDSIGNLTNISAIQTRGIDWDPAGNDVMIDLGQNNAVTACFASGALIDTPDGPRRVEDIAEGDWVTTLDKGPMPVIWRHSRTYETLQGSRVPKLQPVRVRRGSLQAGIPNRDLFLSPQHRIMVASRIAEHMFGDAEVLVPVVKLLTVPGISRADDVTCVTYHHLSCGHHAIILANGAPVETFLPELQALRMLDRQARHRIDNCNPDHVVPARRVLDGGPLLREFIRRHIKNKQPLLQIHRRLRPATDKPRLIAEDGQRLG